METRLFNLTEKMIRSSAKTSPKLKTRAGETRALVPWAWEIAQTMLDQLDPFEQAIFFAIKYLHQAYLFFPCNAFMASARSFTMFWCMLQICIN